MSERRLDAVLVLERSARLLIERVAELEARLRQGDEAAWPHYLATLDSLAMVLGHVSPGRREDLLTTSEMAARLNISTKTLLRRKSRGDIRPAVQYGKRLIRWRGNEVGR